MRHLLRIILPASLLLVSLAACAGEPTPPATAAIVAEAATASPAPTETTPAPPTATSRFSTVSPDRLTELPSLRDLATVPTFTPTATFTVTPTPTLTHTPTPTLTATPLRPEDYCDLLTVTTLRPPDTIYREDPVTFRFFMPRTDVALRFELVHEETEETFGTVDLPGGEVIAGSFDPADLPYSGRYDWRVTVVNPQGGELCTESSYFLIEKPESTAEATAEATLEVTAEVTTEMTPEVTAEATEEAE